MFFYLYDSFVLDKKHEGALTKVENRVIELGINGRVEKLTPLRNLKDVLEGAIKQEAHTIVIVGDDTTLVRAINVLAHHKVSVGYIPFGNQSSLAKVFGIPDTFEACNILSRRITKLIDLGKANQNYFITAATTTESSGLRIKCDGEFTVSFPNNPMTIGFMNLGDILNKEFSSNELCNVTDRRLLLKMSEQPHSGGWLQHSPIKINRSKPALSTPSADITVLPLSKAELTHVEQPVPIVLDQITTLKTPLTISVKAKQLKMIVGKDRLIK